MTDSVYANGNQIKEIVKYMSDNCPSNVDISGKENKFRYSVMPAASAEYVGKSLQYTGETSQNFTQYYFYQCVELDTDPISYEWQEINVQSGDTGQTIQFDELPTASSDLEGAVFQYTGSNTEDYTHNYFYECKSDGSGGYEWQSVQVQSSSALGNVVVTDNDNLKLNVDASYEPPRVYIKMTGSVESLDFATMSDSDFSKAIQMHYNGLLDLTDYWEIGDERIISMNAIEEYYPSTVASSQAAYNETFRIIDFNHDNLVTPIGVNNKAIITLAPTHIIGPYIGINDVANVKWENEKGRIWCNEYFFNSLPQYIKQLIKEVSKITADVYNSTNTTITSDKVFFPSIKELSLNNYSTGTSVEGTSYSYYTQHITNRIQARNGSYYRYYVRSVSLYKEALSGLNDGSKGYVEVYNAHMSGASGNACTALPMFCI